MLYLHWIDVPLHNFIHKTLLSNPRQIFPNPNTHGTQLLIFQPARVSPMFLHYTGLRLIVPSLFENTQPYGHQPQPIMFHNTHLDLLDLAITYYQWILLPV